MGSREVREKATQNGGRLRPGSLGKEGDLAFPGHAGQPMGPRTVPGGSFERPLGRAKSPAKTRPHDLGRTRATPLLGKGVHPEIVQELPGTPTYRSPWESTHTCCRAWETSG